MRDVTCYKKLYVVVKHDLQWIVKLKSLDWEVTLTGKSH